MDCSLLSALFRFSDGRIYEGEWVSGRREGFGEMRGRPEDGKHPDEWTFYAGNVLEEAPLYLCKV